jgi:ribonucleotide reductase alpha subunit
MKIVEYQDNIIDRNIYPVEECIANAFDYRAIGIGIQGLADVFAIKRIPYDSQEANRLHLEIMETIYHAALQSSHELSNERGSYKAFQGSPVSRGLLKMDLWNMNQDYINKDDMSKRLELPKLTRYDWQYMRNLCKQGMRNSYLLAPMPTVSTSVILNNNESFEPFSHNLYVKTVLNDKYTYTNMYMIRHLMELGLWNDKLKNDIIANKGFLTGLQGIPANIQNIYKTSYCIKQADYMKQIAIVSAFVDQSQSLNIYVKNNSNKILDSIFMKGHQLGLTTGSYYIRSLAASDAMNNNAGLDKKDNNLDQNTTQKLQACYIGCDSCSS